MKTLVLLASLIAALVIIGYFSAKYLPSIIVVMLVSILIIGLMFRFLKDNGKILKM